jgi:DnaJ-class molecular chaperone
MKDGQKIRLKGMGASGKDGGEPGDLYLKVQIRKPFLQKFRQLLKI